MDSKTCNKCRKLKKLTDFSIDNSKKDKKHTICKECQTEYKKYYRLKNKERNRAHNEIHKKNYYSKNKEAIRAKQKEYYEKNKIRINEKAKLRYKSNPELKNNSHERYKKRTEDQKNKIRLSNREKYLNKKGYCDYIYWIHNKNEIIFRNKLKKKIKIQLRLLRSALAYGIYSVSEYKKFLNEDIYEKERKRMWFKKNKKRIKTKTKIYRTNNTTYLDGRSICKNTVPSHIKPIIEAKIELDKTKRDIRNFKKYIFGGKLNV